MYYKPRMKLIMTVPYFGATARDDAQTLGTSFTKIEVVVRKATFERNNHLTADTLSIDTEWADSSVDPRWLKNATCAFFLGDINLDEELVSEKNLRFTGVLVRCRRTGSYSSGFSVSMEFHDYTNLFINTKPFPTDGVPDFSNTLTSAWERICEYTGWYDADKDKVQSSVNLLKKNITFIGIPGSKPLGDAVPGRFTKLSPKLQPKEGSSAWDVWQYTVGIFGLTSFIDRDRCVVTTAAEHYKKTGAPIAIWGKNIFEADESINTRISNRGIRLVSFNHLEGKVLESFYPPPGDQRIKVKRSRARSKHYTPDEIQSAQYETFEYFNVQSQSELDKIAESAYNEFARQEIEGSIKTGEMFMESKTAGKFVDLLSLRSGSPIVVEIDKLDKEKLVNQFNSGSDRIDYLKTRGYSEDIAKLIVGNLQSFDTLNSEFHVDRTVVTLDEKSYEAQIFFKNQIDIRGYTKDPVVRNTPDESDPDSEPNIIVIPGV